MIIVTTRRVSTVAAVDRVIYKTMGMDSMDIATRESMRT